MIEETLAAAIKPISDYTVLRAWIAEVLVLLVLCAAWRFGLGVWLFDATMVSAAVGPGPASGVASASVADAAA